MLLVNLCVQEQTYPYAYPNHCSTSSHHTCWPVLLRLSDLHSPQQFCRRLCLLQVLPGCLLLHFAAADLQEAEGNIEAARQVYHELLPSLNPDEPVAAPPPQVTILVLLPWLCEQPCPLNSFRIPSPPLLSVRLTKHTGCMTARQYQSSRSQY